MSQPLARLMSLVSHAGRVEGSVCPYPRHSCRRACSGFCLVVCVPRT